MKNIPLLILLSGATLAATVLPGLADQEKKKADSPSQTVKEEKTKPTVVLSDEEWKKKLTPEQYRILREDGTERPNGKIYEEVKKQGAGTYYCAGCDAELFTSTEKFDSKCGWPSFFNPSKAKNITYHVDYHLGYPRTEVRCKACDGHLGHVFEGEGFDTPTDKRYCINGTILKFVPAEEGKTPEQKTEPDSDKGSDKPAG